jgi:putative protease
MVKPELLSPGGDLEKLKIAVLYGADAVYVGAESFGLRAMAGNFSWADLYAGVDFAHQHKRKVYLTMNIFPHNEDLLGLDSFIDNVNRINIDAMIVSDPGMFSYIRSMMPDMEIHISTQANTLNWRSAEFWRKAGAGRIILSREVSLSEIVEIHERVDIPLEGFVHGSMCMAYSGRCFLSHYLTGRDANLGECTQPCRWPVALVEERRPGQYFPIIETTEGTSIMNSKDLCMIEHIPELIKCGLSSLKIEGRMKSLNYVASVTKAYREAIDTFFENPLKYEFQQKWLDELHKASHREFCTGFFFHKPSDNSQISSYEKYFHPYDLMGVVMKYDQGKGHALIEQRNKICRGDTIEIYGPKGDPYYHQVTSLEDLDGNQIDSTPHPKMEYRMHVDTPLEQYSIVRRKRNLLA